MRGSNLEQQVTTAIRHNVYLCEIYSSLREPAGQAVEGKQGKSWKEAGTLKVNYVLLEEEVGGVFPQVGAGCSVYDWLEHQRAQDEQL